MAQIEGKAGDAKTELRMAIAGPITSVVIGLICLTLTRALEGDPAMIPQAPVEAMFWWLGYINIGLDLNEKSRQCAVMYRRVQLQGVKLHHR